MDKATKQGTLGLRKLVDTDLTLGPHSDDVRGRPVVDCDGQKLGTIDALFVDEDERKVRFVRLSTGGFLGIGATKLLIPVDAVAEVDAEFVRVSQNRERVASAPGYDPELMERREYFQGLYDYYGYNPYWSAGYSYPRFAFAPPPPPVLLPHLRR